GPKADSSAAGDRVSRSVSVPVVMRLPSLVWLDSEVAHPDLRRSGRLGADCRRTPHAACLSGLAGVQRRSDDTYRRASLEIGGSGRVVSDFRVQRIREYEPGGLIREVVNGIRRPNRREVKVPGDDIPAVRVALSRQESCATADDVTGGLGVEIIA